MQQRQSSTPPPPLAPIDLINQVSIPRQNAVVSGKVTHISDVYNHQKFGRNVFVQIKGPNGDEMKVICPPDQVPVENSIITAQGEVFISTKFNKVEIMLRGNVLAALRPKDEIKQVKYRPNKIPLVKLINEHQVHNLLVICSSNAQRDYRDQIRRERISVTWRETVTKGEFKNPQTMLSTIKANLTPRTSGIVFTRGGLGDHENDMWNNAEFINKIIDLGKPFYTAVGHKSTYQLVDRVCDESFSTPTDLGSQLAKICSSKSSKSVRVNKSGIGILIAVGGALLILGIIWLLG